MSLYLDIEKKFPDFSLSVSLEGKDEVVALLGNSGCGKSLTLKCIAGIEKPDRGRIVINGETVFDSEKRINLPPQKRNVGFLFQNYALFPTMTVWKNIASVINKTKSEKHRLVADMIKLFQLENVKNLYPSQISGGQQQRTALARILVSEPEIILLDEPFSALDTQLKWSVEQEVVSILESFHGTTIFVSHNRDEVYRISDKIAVMYDGNIETVGTNKDIFDSPKTLNSALMTGCKNISAAEKIDDNHIKALEWGVSLKTTSTVPDDIRYVGVRAHHFQRVSHIENDENTFYCNTHKVIDEPFEKVYLFSFDTNDTNSKSEKTLQFDVAKDILTNSDSKELILHIPEDKVMCLE